MEEEVERGVDHLVERHRTVGVVCAAECVERPEERRRSDHRVNAAQLASGDRPSDDRPGGLLVLVEEFGGAVVGGEEVDVVELFSLRPDPSDPTRSTARLTMLVPGDRADEIELWDRNWERVNVTIPDEDFAAAVDVQRNIDAGGVDELRVGANERFLLRHLEAVRARTERLTV